MSQTGPTDIKIHASIYFMFTCPLAHYILETSILVLSFYGFYLFFCQFPDFYIINRIFLYSQQLFLCAFHKKRSFFAQKCGNSQGKIV